MMTVQGVKYMSDFEAKKAILDIGKRMYDKGFVASNDGNISCKVGPNTIWTTPTGVSKGFMKQDMLVKMDLNGKVLMGKAKPSSEVKMHLRVYQENPDVQAVTHAHPLVATSFAIAGISLDTAVLTEAVLGLGSIPIAKYATPGTEEVPDSIAPFVNTHNGVLLANHGALTWGKDIFQAFYRLESIEYYATILMYTGNIIGRQNVLSCDQVNKLLDIRQKLGITAGGIPPCSLQETNMRDVITSSDIRPSWPAAPIQAPLNPPVNELKGVTPLVKPGQSSYPKEGGCSCGITALPKETVEKKDTEHLSKAKEEIIAEVVRRVMGQFN
ncbi:class II aldolase/adducin family protein [Lacrimispora sp. 38-1]|uniref:class II aldolase/adducin family protein n=1 Tax=Lacrimispora sp. 38-1 TaxID=3125778 RepID=UPI003CEA9EAC